MKVFKYSEIKDVSLKRRYGLGFEEIITGIEKNLIDVVENPTRSHQRIFVFIINNYVYAAPFVENETDIFLKTFYPSRKLTKKYFGTR